MRFGTFGFLLAMTITGFGAHAADAPDVVDTRKNLNVVFAQDVEMKLALSAAPESLRTSATVYVYGKTGFDKVRDGTNGFTCLVNRDAFFYGGIVFKPTCWDPEGTTSYVPVMLRVGRMLSEGQTLPIIRALVDAEFRAGNFRRPAKTGIAYMLAGDVELDAKGKVTRAHPGHYMIYAPGVTDSDIGSTPAARKLDPSLPFVFSRGAGGSELGYIIAIPHH